MRDVLKTAGGERVHGSVHVPKCTWQGGHQRHGGDVLVCDGLPCSAGQIGSVSRFTRLCCRVNANTSQQVPTVMATAIDSGRIALLSFPDSRQGVTAADPTTVEEGPQTGAEAGKVVVLKYCHT